MVKNLRASTVGALIASVLALGVTNVQLFELFLGTHSLVVATSPVGAQIKVDGEDRGQAPKTLNLKRGTYTIEARRAGYEPAQHAVFVSGTEPNVVNIQLMPLPSAQKAHPGVTQPAGQFEAPDVLEELEKLKAALISDPDEALSLPLLRERLRVQEEFTQALREDLRDIKAQSKWYLGSMIAIVVGLLGVIATLFASQRSRTDA